MPGQKTFLPLVALLTLVSVICPCNLLTPTIPPSPQLTSPAPVVTQPAPFPTPGPAATAATPSDDSIYNENIPHTRAERIVISEIFLLREALQLLVQRGWDGNPDRPLPLSAADFDPAHLQAYIADESHDDQALTLPAELESIYISPDAAAEIAALLLQARDEYMDYAASQGTLPLYLDEVNQRTLPHDPARLLYHPINDPNAPPTEVGPLTVGERDDFSQLVLNVYPVDIYNAAESLRKAKILGEEPASAAERLAYNRRLRDIGLRFLVYHEMTHVLQRAYITVHTPEEYRMDKAAWIYASQTLIDVDTQYHWKWGGHFADVNNRHISNESQAEGIAFVVLVAHYNMSPQQQAAAWDHLFGRLEDSRAALDEARDLFDRYFPDYPPDNFGSQLGPVMESYTNPAGRYTLMQICSRLSNLPAAVGYLHPMLPQDTVKFWAALREP